MKKWEKTLNDLINGTFDTKEEIQRYTKGLQYKIDAKGYITLNGEGKNLVHCGGYKSWMTKKVFKHHFMFFQADEGSYVIERTGEGVKYAIPNHLKAWTLVHKPSSVE